MSLLDLEYAECCRRLTVEDDFSRYGGEYNNTMDKSYSCCMVSNEILLYRKDTILGFSRGKGRGYTLGALFKGRYTKENWIADAALFRQKILLLACTRHCFSQNMRFPNGFWRLPKSVIGISCTTIAPSNTTRSFDIILPLSRRGSLAMFHRHITRKQSN